MKKLLITAMAAVSVGLCAKAADAIDASTFTENGTSFDNLTTGDDFAGDNNFWQTPEGEGDLFKIIDVVYPEGATPQHWALATQEKALSIDTATPIFRNVNPRSDANPPLDVSNKSVFFDSVVQFTATDVAPVIDLSNEAGNKDKLIVWLYSSPEDVAEGNPGALGETTAVTNLVITSGYYDNGTVIQKNYLTDKEITPETWHRLTIKSFIQTEGNLKGRLMFNVFIDGQSEPISVDGVTDFLSLVDVKEVQDTYLQGVAFDGKGAVDDIVFTTTEPAFTKGNVFNVVISTPTNAEIIGVMDSNDENTSFAVGEDGKYSVPVGTTSIIVAVTYAGTITNDGAEPIEEGTWAIPVDVSSAVAGDTIQVEITAANTVVTYPTVKPNGDSTTQETLSASAAAAIKAALEGVETMPDALTVIVNEKEYFGDEAVAKINEVVAMFKAAKEGETLKFFNNKGEMIVSFKAKNPLMETETAEATDYEATVGESAATVTSDYTVNKETVDLTPGVAGENEAVTFKLVIKPVGSTGSDTGSEEQN